MSKQAVKVYKTSIIPEGGRMEPLRDHKMIATSLQVEVVHIIVFLAVISFIFGGLWKAATASAKKQADLQAKTKGRAKEKSTNEGIVGTPA